MGSVEGAWDVVVIGAGFGGLGAAVELAERGARVLVVETLKYPGGCASTFTRNGYQFEAGATLFSGFDRGQLMRRWIDRHALDVVIDYPDPLIELRADIGSLSLGRDRKHLNAALSSRGPGDVAGFLDQQKKVADTLWSLFDEPALLPPLAPTTLLRHLGRSSRYAPLLPLIGRPLETLLRRYGVQDHEWLRLYLDALCQITVQCDAAHAEAPFALGAMDYLFRGTGHVRGGIGKLATALSTLVERLGGAVAFATRATRISRARGGFAVHTRRGIAHAPTVVANLLPRALSSVAAGCIGPSAQGTLSDLDRKVRTGWGAAMLYLGVHGDGLPEHAHHLELVADRRLPLIEGNHLFCSISAASESARAPGSQRTVTISTHVKMPSAEPSPEHGARIDAIHERMWQTLRLRALELAERVAFSMSASPRTFERFTGRPGGYVGGIPRIAGIANYRLVGPLELERGLYLVGDTAFPGQSTLAAALGGARTGAAIATRRMRAA